MDFQTLVSRVIQQESGGNPNAVSPVGAAGLMQIMPATARAPGFGVSPMDWDQRFNPAANRAFGEAYLQAMIDRYNGDQERALAAYNWGAGNADKWDGQRSSLPEETQGYLRNIIDKAPSGPAGAPISMVQNVAPSAVNPAAMASAVAPPTFAQKAEQFAGLFAGMEPVRPVPLTPIRNNYRPRGQFGA